MSLHSVSQRSNQSGEGPGDGAAQGLKAEGELGGTQRQVLVELHDPRAVFTLVSEPWDPLLKQNLARKWTNTKREAWRLGPRPGVCPQPPCSLAGSS